MNSYLRISVFLIFFGNCLCWKNTNIATKKLLQKIYDPYQYDKNIIPLEDAIDEPLIVGINMLIRNLQIDEKNMEYVVDMTYRMAWKDYRLQYNQLPGVKYVQFNDYKLIWTPDPFFKSSTDTRILETFGPESLVRINSTGHVLLSTRMSIRGSCIMDLEMFPHDSQECQIKIASYGYATDRLIFVSMMEDPLVIVKNTAHANRFDVTSFGIDRCDSMTSTGSYTCLSVKLRMNRTFSSYLLEWYIPCTCFVIISFMSHLMPSEEVIARILLTITPMLALGVSTINYISTLPSVPYATAFDVFSSASLIAIFFSLLHVVASYYFSKLNSKRAQHDSPESPDGSSSQKKNFFQDHADIGFRMVIVGFYLFFLVIYSIQYNF